jgi:hypothetical protein
METKLPEKISIIGHAEETLCGDSCGGAGVGSSDGHGCAACLAGEKKRLDALVEEFSALVAASPYRGIAVEFLRADGPEAAAMPGVARLLAVAELSPMVAIDGRPFCWGGFSPAGMLRELEKRYPLGAGGGEGT